MKKYTFSLLFLLFATLSFAQSSAIGRWETIDDNSGKKRSVVKIYEKEGKLYGDIEKLYREPGEELDPVCEECKDERKGQKVIGLNIIRGMEQDGEEWKNGEIMDPENGKTYDCKFWLEDDNTLKVRGYILFLYRTQTWYRAKDE